MIGPEDVLGGKILIVDDLPANISLLERTLRAAGYRSVSSTTKPADVCGLHLRNNYDLILLDLQMPRMDGFQVMEALKEIRSDDYIPVLAVTANPEHKLRALRCGAKDFISKPFDLAEVLMRVRNMLEVRLLHEASRRHEKELESLALTDPLTGLANRRLLSDRLERALVHARRERGVMAVVSLDLDGFKGINDTLGHAAGDALLKLVAVRLTAAVRADDTVARLGGDEFLIALWRIKDPAYAAGVAGKILEALSQPFLIEGRAVQITASAGIAIYPLHGADADALLRSADSALYAAKHAGKNAARTANGFR